MKKKSLRLKLIISSAIFIVAIISYLSFSNNKSSTKKSCSVSEQGVTGQTANSGSDLTKPNKKHSKQSDTLNQTKTDLDKNISSIFNQLIAFRKQPSEDALNIICGYLNNPNRVIAKTAINTLAVVGSKIGRNEYVFNILAKKAMDKEFNYRGDALLTAATVGKDKLLPIVSEYISEAGKDSDFAGYDYASKAIALISSPACVPYLNSLLNNTEDEELHRNCFETLARIATPEAAGILEEHLLSSNLKDQTSSALALTRLNSPEYNQIMADKIIDKSFQANTISAILASRAAPDIVERVIKEKAMESKDKSALLNNIGAETPYISKNMRNEISSSIGSLLTDKKETKRVKLEAIKTLHKLGGEETADLLAPELKNEDPDIRREAAFAFTLYADPYNYTALSDLIWDSDKKTRRTALLTISRFISEEDRPLLEKAVEHEDEYIRNRAQELLDSIS